MTVEDLLTILNRVVQEQPGTSGRHLPVMLAGNPSVEDDLRTVSVKRIGTSIQDIRVVLDIEEIE